jgi:hypothetical protein
VKHRATVYLSRDGRRVLVVGCNPTETGILVESNDVIELEQPSSPDEIGAAVRAAVRSSHVVDQDLRSRTVKDWGAYRTSRARSVRQFEANFISVSVEALNDANLFYDVSAEPEPEDLLRVVSTINAHATDYDLGERILEVYKAARDRRL